MRDHRSTAWLPVAVAAMALAACRSAPVASPPAVVLQPGTGTQPIDGPPRITIRPLQHTAADIDFMSGMIPHHAQAIVMASMVPTHTTRADLRILAERIIVSQRDEIRLMQRWLRDRNLPVPDSNATHHRMRMGDMVHDMLMPGMLSAEELAQLDRARGPEFDRLFLTFMIRHHEGARGMVRTLFDSPGSGQEETVFRFASDVEADQSAEIHRMRLMLERGG